MVDPQNFEKSIFERKLEKCQSKGYEKEEVSKVLRLFTRKRTAWCTRGQSSPATARAARS